MYLFIYLFILCLFNAALCSSDYTVLDGMRISEYWIGDVERSIHCLIWGIILD
jgi:hypothetical protein